MKSGVWSSATVLSNLLLTSEIPGSFLPALALCHLEALWNAIL